MPISGVNYFGLNNLIGSLAGRAVARILLGCESKEGASGGQQDTVQDVVQEPFCSSKYYICDEFGGEKVGSNTWNVSEKGESLSIDYTAKEGELTISSSQGNDGLDTGVGLSSVQSAGLPESGNFYHGVEARVKLGGSSSFTLSDGTNACKIGSSSGAICGGSSINETDYYEAKVADVSEWHTYSMSTFKALDGSGNTEVILYQDNKEITKFHQGPTIKYSIFTAGINCWLTEIGSCTFDYVRGQVTDQNQW